MSKNILKTITNITIGAVLGAAIATGTLLTINGNLGIAKVTDKTIQDSEGNREYCCEVLTYNKSCDLNQEESDNVIDVVAENKKVGNKILFFRKSHITVVPDWQFKIF